MSWLNDAEIETVEEKNAKYLESQRQALKRTRDEALQSLSYTLSDGSVLQTRPQDLSNFQAAIAAGGDQKWILADNTVRITTVTELQEALDDAVAKAKIIWDDYADSLEALGD